MVSSRVVSHKVIGIKDSSKTVVRVSDSGQQFSRAIIAIRAVAVAAIRNDGPNLWPSEYG